MLTDELRNRIDKVRKAFWTGYVENIQKVFQQITMFQIV